MRALHAAPTLLTSTTYFQLSFCSRIDDKTENWSPITDYLNLHYQPLYAKISSINSQNIVTFYSMRQTMSAQLSVVYYLLC